MPSLSSASNGMPQGLWALQDAKARFSELTRFALSQGPQHVTIRGERSIVVLSEKDFRKLKGKKSKPTLLDLFRKSPFEPTDIDLSRDRDTGRTLEF